MGLVILSISVHLLLLMALAGLVQSLRFDLSGLAPKCLAEEIQAKVLVLANYQVIGDDVNRRISAKVTSPYGNVLHSAENVESSQFGFTTSETGNYMACFWMSVSPPDNPVLSVELDWKIGVAARDWESVARKDKIEGIELELMKLQGAVEAIHENLVYMREREKEMRNVSEFTNTRVAWFGITSLMICLAVAGWQLWHLKSYFERKKLI